MKPFDFDFRTRPHHVLQHFSFSDPTINKWRELQRNRQPLATGADAVLAGVPTPEDTHFWEVEYRQYLVGKALRLMQTEFEEPTWKACWECVVADRSAADVARDLGLSVNAVYLAKSRVLRRLHQELDGMID